MLEQPIKNEIEQPVSFSAYAKMRGCSDVAIHKAVKAGKIVKGVVTEETTVKGKPHTVRKILPSVANAEWLSAYNPNYIKNHNLDKAFFGSNQSSSEGSILENEDVSLSPTEARNKKQVYDMLITKLEFEQKSGKLVEKDLVYKQLYAFGQQVRQSILSVPTRVVEDMLACTNRVEAHTVLERALSEALEKLSETEVITIK